MKKLYFIFTVSMVMLINQETKSQMVFFQEDFEHAGVIPNGWQNIYVVSNNNWRYQNGGHTTSPAIPNSRRPTAAHGGLYNAIFEKSTLTSVVTKLVTPTIDLSLAIKPELRFWFANYTRTILSDENDEIRVYYRSIDEDTYNWVLLASITEPNEAWTQFLVLIPDSVRFTNVQLAFEGTTGPGWGACIDDITIIETGIIPKYLESVKASQASVNNIPTGSINNPILRLDFAVKGNEGNLTIDTLKVDALLESEQIVPAKGIKLYFTTSSNFTLQNPKGDSLQFVDGKAVFTNLGLNLPFGYSYLWITYDVPTDLTHTFNGLKLDAKISKDNLIINGIKYPFVDLNPSGSRTVNESVFFDDFENTTNWTLSGEFQIAHPMGLGGNFGTPDPEYPQNGDKSLGTDLTGLGLLVGDYENDVADNGYTAISSSINCKYYKDISLQFYRWLNVENSDSAKIQIDSYQQNQWRTVWNNSSLMSDDKWSQKQYSIKQYADRVDDVSIQFVIGPTNNTWTFSGWNIDDFAVTGTFIQTDAGVAAWINPGAGCGHIAPEPITLTIKNFGHNATNDTIPVGFSVDEGETWVLDTLFASLNQEASTNFTFTPLIDLTAPGNHHILVKTFLPGDQDDRNDQLDTTLFIIPTINLPYAQDFETNNGYWQIGGNETWEYGVPSGLVLDSAASGSFCWVTKLTNNYPDFDSSWIESPCFVFTGVEKPIFEMKIQSETEVGKDGLALYYTIDNGITWKIVPTADAYNWNWYTGAIDGLGSQGWDSVKPGWWMARQTLPAEIAGESLVKFRLVFASNDSINNEGFAIDDIRIYEAPNDAGVTAMINPVTACYLTASENVQVTLNNFGIRSIKPTDPLITSLMLNNTVVVTDTFHVASNLAPLGTANFTFSEPVTMIDSGNYQFIAYTHIPEDSNVYTAGVPNDTLYATRRVNGIPTYSLGPDIGTMQPDTVVIDAGSGYTTYHWHDNSTARYFNADTAGYFYVTVTNSYGCSANDSLEIMGSTTDLALTAAVGIADGCILSYTPALKLTVLNNGDTTYHSGDTIQLAYQINNGPKVIETYTATTDIVNGATFEYIFTAQPDLSLSGVMNFTCFPEFQPQLNYKNDTIYKTIELYPLPQINLGQDTLFTNVPSPILLDAGSGFSTYDWQDNSTNQTFSVSAKTSAKYFVEVTDVHTCGTASDTVWVISDEWKLDSILNPSEACTHLTSETIQIRIKNQSENNYPSGFTIPAKLVYNNVTYNENIVLNTPVPANGTYNHTFVQTFNFSVPDNYSIKAEISPVFDLITTNNLKIKSFATHGVYFVDLGYDTIVTKQADTVVLDAGAHFAILEWNTGAISQTIQLPHNLSYQYSVTATDAFECQTSTDTVSILASDLAIDAIYSPQSSCELNNETTISFLLHNYGNDNIPAGTAISVYYQLNSGSWIEKPFSLTFDLQPNKTKTITVNENLVFVSGQNYDFGLRIAYTKDLFFENDTIRTSIFEFEKPSVYLGPDVFTAQPDTVVFQAQSGNFNYQWQDLSTFNHYNVTNTASAKYHCLVSNAYGCTDADTVELFSYDIRIGDIIGDENECGTFINKNVQLGITVNGADTLRAGQAIQVAYQCNGISASETYVLSENLYISKTLYHTFANPLIISNIGNYPFTAQVSMVNEAVTTNNNYTSTIHVGTKKVDLGADVITYDPSVTLDAGIDFMSYLWSNNSIAQTLLVTANGNYSVTTTDSYGCTDADTVNVFFKTPKYDVIEIIGLADSCVRKSMSGFSFILKNNGNDIISADSTIAIKYKINGGTSITENYTFDANFEPADDLEIPFQTPADLMSPNTYIVLVEVTIGSRLSAFDSIIHTYGLPLIKLPADTASYGNSIILNAGAGFTSYFWSNDSTTQTILVENSGTFSVTVINSNECSNSASVNVLFLNPSYEIIEIKDLSNSCLHSNEEIISFVLTNTGNDIIYADSVIPIQYQINSEEPVIENYLFTSNLNPDDEVIIAFETTADLSESNTYEISVSATFGTASSTLDSTINTWGLPLVSLGDDVETTDETVTLDAGAGFTSYLWNTTQTTQTITISTDGTYWVRVANIHNCLNSDTIKVVFVPVNLNITDFITPLFGCGSLVNEEVTIKIKNSGIKDLLAGTNLVIAYKLGDNPQVDETVELATNFIVNASLTYNFATRLSISESSTGEEVINYPIDFFIYQDNEELDNAEFTITIHTKPEFFEGNDTLEVPTYPYILDAKVTAESYLWSTGANTETISVTTDGEYKLTITQANTCQFNDSILVTKLNAISDGWRQSISVYPNPADKKIQIKINDTNKNIALRITDIQGRLVYELKNAAPITELDIANWSKGIYLLTVFYGTEQEIYQMIKN